MAQAATRSTPAPPDRLDADRSHGRRTWLADAAVLVIIAAIWQLWVCRDVVRLHPVAFDTYRDTAVVENILASRWLCDASIPGQTYWYAPLGPIIFAGLSAMTGRTPVGVYSSSILWLNVFLPIGWYTLARLCWNRRAALAAVPLVLFGSRWWMTHMAMPMTSIHGVMLCAAVVSVWVISWRCRRWTAVPVGLLLAFCIWYHILSGIIAAAVIGLHALLWAERPSVAREGRIGSPRREAHLRLLFAAVVTAPLVAPLAWHMLKLPRINTWPMEYLAGELRDPRYALQSQTPLVLPLAVVGLLCACRKIRGPAGLIVVYASATLLGQALGYIRMWTSLRLPVLIPHEFQWHFQIAVGLLAAVGTGEIATWIACRTARAAASNSPTRSPRRATDAPRMLLPRPAASMTLMVLIMIALLVPAVGPAIPSASAAYRENWKCIPPAEAQGVAEAVEWIKKNTSIDDVFLGREPGDFFIVGGLTGRKLACPPTGHTNIAVDAAARDRDRMRMLETNSPDEFRRLVAQYGVDFILLQREDEMLAKRWLAGKVVSPAFRPPSGFPVILRVNQ